MHLGDQGADVAVRHQRYVIKWAATADGSRKLGNGSQGGASG